MSGTFDINWNEIESLPHANRMRSEPSQFDFYANLARSVQSDLEDVALQMLRSLREHTGEDHLVFTGGVALNSVLNGHIRCEQNLFREVYVPPAPGDEGIALGCAMYGFQVYLFYSEMFSMCCLFDLFCGYTCVFRGRGKKKFTMSVFVRMSSDPLQFLWSLLPIIVLTKKKTKIVPT